VVKEMKESICKEFEQTVLEYLIRHQSILDLLSKTQETNARINRAVTKAVTQCGCIEVNAKKAPITQATSVESMKTLISSQLTGELCEHCQEMIEQELGKNLFYLTGLCNTLGLSLEDVLDKENKKVKTLRQFNFT
jgi:predicted house-cleaning noncanonical NTP pyrophosphatase (MazG superfamily)